MNCQFCQTEMVKGPTYSAPKNSYWQDHRCYACRSIFTLDKKTLKVMRHVLYVEKYRLDSYYHQKTFTVGVFQDESATYKEAYRSSEFVPNITPANALHKVKTILVFQ